MEEWRRGGGVMEGKERGGLLVERKLCHYDERYYLCIMRIQGTKYESIEQLPLNAIPVSLFTSKYGKRFNIRSSSYAHIKYDRYYIGYRNKAGELLHTEHPGYDIVDFHGTCYVINYQ